MATYTHGHHESVLRSHRWRTAENSAAYLLPWLKSGDAVLDVGCGPGTITVGLARHVPRGAVIAFDPAAEAVAEARSHVATAGVVNVRVEQADVHTIGLDGPVDVAHAHQVLQHVSDPIGTLQAMAAHLRPGGVVAVRDADYDAMSWWPRLPELDEWRTLYRATAHALGAEPDAARVLPAWCRAAGLLDVQPSLGTWLYATPEDRNQWAGMWARRATESSFATHAVRLGLAEASDLARIAAGWRVWGEHPDGWLAILHGQVLARV